MKLYNTLTRSVEPFTPLDPHGRAVTMYVCGPTVYDDPHIGHARSAYIFDVLRRYLAFKGYQVRFVRNVTDVDDKIIEKARQELAHSTQHTAHSDLKGKCREVAERYLRSYHEAMDRLGILRPDVEPKATEHVTPDARNVEATKQIDASMTGFISRLLTNNMAYTAGGDVYFPVRKFAEYGQLSNRSLDDLKAGARVESGEGKQDPLDFALWKAAKPEEPSWSSPWGAGRPGWHIECSVMSTAYLGDAFDIHGGGVDLVFPHHENEIAQARALGKSFAKCWVHNGLLTVSGEKMSKSLGNFITIDQALKEFAGRPDGLKMFFLSAHYRSPIDYSPTNLRAAESRYHRLVNFCHRVWNADTATAPHELPVLKDVLALQEEFLGAMDSDLNTPEALAALDKLVTAGYAMLDQLHRGFVAQTIVKLGKLLGLFSEFLAVRLTRAQRQLLGTREAARQRRDFATADEIRTTFAAEGLAIEDTPEGPIVLPAS